MIFTFRQLQEKCREQRTPLLTAFVDLNKAFDTVSREGLYAVLQRIGCPPKLLNLIRLFHEDMKASVVYKGNTSDPLDMRRGVRQGCVLAPTLFGIFFSVLLKVAFGDNQQGIHLHTRVDRKLFNISRLKSKKHRQDIIVDSLLFADDAAFVASSPSQLQEMLDRFNKACKQFSMSINERKTVIMTQGITEIPTISLDGSPLEVVENFCYLGSTVTNNLCLDAEINSRIGKASTMFGKLSARVWHNKYLTVKTKIIIYQTCILSILLYGAETWTSYAKQERRLNNFHMRCLRRILDISWKDRVTNEKVLSMACIPSITALLKQRRLRWLGHVQRMEPSRLPRQTLLGQISDAKRPVGRPLLRFKDSVKRDMVSFKIDPNIWEKLSDDRDSWRKKLSDGVVAHDSAWFDLLSKKRDLRHQRMAQPPTSPGTQFVCGRCDRRCRSRIGLVSHQRKCQSQTT
nr:uncharacterized protein LOC126055306 [Helicoverpa armigera]